MITTAPRSSRIARADKKIFNDNGARLPSRASTPRAKAMSVAAGMAQPFTVSALPQLTAR
ncbi:hypothetical protein D3C77_722000 [compost metagenome]